MSRRLPVKASRLGLHVVTVDEGGFDSERVDELSEQRPPGHVSQDTFE